jgi:hypothetical protein
MANFANPTVGSNYTDFPGEIRASVNAALQQLSVGSHTNIPTGAIKFDTSANRWKKFNGSAFVDLTASYDLNAVVSVNELQLEDDEKIRLGSSQQFEIFHQSSNGNSIIKETGGGIFSLQTNGSQISFYDVPNNVLMAEFNTGGSCIFRHAGNTKLQTNSNGIQVTSRVGIGRAAGQPLDVEGNAQIGAASTDDAELIIGRSGSGNRNAYIDFIGDNTYTDYGFRIQRFSGGANAASDLRHRGTGAFRLMTQDSAEIQFHTGSSQRAVITTAGRLGIGTSNPDTRLHVHKASAGGASSDNNSVLTLENNNHCILQMLSPAANSNRIMFGDPAATNSGEINYDHNINSLLIKTNGSEQIRVDSSGKVGIGTTNPSQELTIRNSDPRIRLEDSDQSVSVEIQNNSGNGVLVTNGATNLIFRTDNAEGLRLTSDQKFGIGTNSPDVRLDVSRLGAAWSGQDPIAGTVAHFHNGNNSSVSPAYIGLGGGTGSVSGINFGDADDADVGKIYYRHTTNNIEIHTNTAERVRINNSGRFGVGTTSINRKFHVAGASGQTIFELQRTNANTGGALGTISFTASDDHSVASISATGDGDNEGANLVFRTTSAAADNDPYNAATPIRFTITSGGNLKVPDNGRLIFGAGNGTDGDLQIYHDQSNSYIDCPSSGTGHLIIKADDFLVQGSNAESMIKGIENAGVELFHNNSSKFFTSSLGAVVSGRLGVGTETSPSHTVDIKGSDNTLLLLESTDRHALIEIHDTGGNIALGNDQGNLRLMAAGSDRIRINSSGVGIGTTSPDHTLEIRQSTASNKIVAINRANSNVAAMYLGNDSNDNAIFSVNGDSNNLRFGKDVSGTFTQFMSINTNGDLFLNNDRYIKWGTSSTAFVRGNDNSYLAFGVNTETFRISANALRIGQTGDDTVGQDDTNVGASIEKNGRISSSTSGTETGLNLNANTTSTDKHFIAFRQSGSLRGSVKQTSGGVQFNTTSDRRLKENIVDIKDALLTLLKLKPKEYNWKSDKNKVSEHGFIAQDLLEDKLCEYAVAYSEKEDSYGMDYGRLTAITIAAIQELAGKVSDLEAKLG